MQRFTSYSQLFVDVRTVAKIVDHTFNWEGWLNPNVFPNSESWTLKDFTGMNQPIIWSWFMAFEYVRVQGFWLLGDIGIYTMGILNPDQGIVVWAATVH